MSFWEDRMRAVTEFAGYGSHRPWMEVFVIGPDDKIYGTNTDIVELDYD